jgi:hypothetical protein
MYKQESYVFGSDTAQNYELCYNLSMIFRKFLSLSLVLPYVLALALFSATHDSLFGMDACYSCVRRMRRIEFKVRTVSARRSLSVCVCAVREIFHPC